MGENISRIVISNSGVFLTLHNSLKSRLHAFYKALEAL